MQEFEYSFWFWSHKLKGILSMLCHLADYELVDFEVDFILEKLAHTNNEENNWFEYSLIGRKNRIEINLAFDGDQIRDMIVIKIRTTSKLKEKLESLDLYQSMFKELILED